MPEQQNYHLTHTLQHSAHLVVGGGAECDFEEAQACQPSSNGVANTTATTITDTPHVHRHTTTSGKL